MPAIMSNNAGHSGAEEQFVQLFCDTFGMEKSEWKRDSLCIYSTLL